jgi:hypothetical protein
MNNFEGGFALFLQNVASSEQQSPSQTSTEKFNSEPLPQVRSLTAQPLSQTVQQPHLPRQTEPQVMS